MNRTKAAVAVRARRELAGWDACSTSALGTSLSSDDRSQSPALLGTASSAPLSHPPIQPRSAGPRTHMPSTASAKGVADLHAVKLRCNI